MSDQTRPTVPPLRRSVTVDWDQATAFRRFTEGISTWWPIHTHSVGQERTEGVVFESRVGGEIFETIRGGKRAVWGRVTAWEPPGRVAFTWHPGREPDAAQEVEVRFVEVGQRTRLELTHSGWENFGPAARRARRGYGLGWVYVLALWAGHTRHPIVLLLDAVVGVIRLIHRPRRERAEPAESSQP